MTFCRSHLPFVSAIMLIGGCTSVGPDYAPPPAGEIGVPAAYQPGISASEQSPQMLASWWLQFDDPSLDLLVDQAILANLDIAQGLARLRQAREALVQARAQRLPTVGASARAGENFDTDGNDSQSYSLGADAAWEADLFGGISRSIEAARADAEGSYYDLAAIQTAIVAETVANYVDLRLAQQRLAIARSTLAISDENLEIAGWRVLAGLVSSLDSEQARAARAQPAATLPSIEANIAGSGYRLAILTGQAPGAANALVAQIAPVPEGPDRIAVGIPADTLRQRPDVRGAERTLAAATARIGVVEAELYPALRITGDFGSSATSIGGLVDLITGSLFAGLTQTLFDGGRIRSRVRSQEAAAQGAYAAYRQTILSALEDVENGLISLDSSQRRRREFAVALDAASNTAILARSQYRAGLTDFQTLLEAERSLLAAREGSLSSQAEQAQAVVQLYRALGGGWDSTVTPQAALTNGNSQ